MKAYDIINEASPIPYVKDFLTQGQADALFAFLQTLPANREFVPRTLHTRRPNRYRMLRYGTYVTNPELRTKAIYGPKLDILTMPPELKALREKLSKHAGKDVNYLSVLGYADQYDHINPHQHKEDYVSKDASVLVVSLGHVRELRLRPVGCKDYESIMPEHGSLYTLPHEYNTTHTHEIPDSKYKCGLRISINCKHEGVPDPKPPFARKPGPPRIYDQHKGKDYPAEAVNVDRNTIFGNHDRHDTATQEGRDAWHAEVAKKMKDARFSWEVGKLRGKDLLCWCSPQQVKDGHCHALVWLRIANGICLYPGCKKPAIGARPDYGIGSNGFCLELHGGANTGDDTHPAQIARGIPKTSPEERLAYEKRLAQMRLGEDKAGSSRPSALLASRNSGA